MSADTWLRSGAIALPLAGALVLWLLGTRFPRTQRPLAVISLGATGLMALSLFLLNRYYACMLAFREQNCLFDGLATLSLLVLSLILVRSCLVLRGADRRKDTIPMLLLAGAWAGMGLAQNLGLCLLFFWLFVFAGDRILRRKGLGWRFLILRDDYADDEERKP